MLNSEIDEPIKQNIKLNSEDGKTIKLKTFTTKQNITLHNIENLLSARKLIRSNDLMFPLAHHDKAKCYLKLEDAFADAIYAEAMDLKPKQEHTLD